MFYTAGVSRFIAEARDTGEVVGLPNRFLKALESDGALRHLSKWLLKKTVEQNPTVFTMAQSDYTDKEVPLDRSVLEEAYAMWMVDSDKKTGDAVDMLDKYERAGFVMTKKY